jgi:hypothetical protein
MEQRVTLLTLGVSDYGRRREHRPPRRLAAVYHRTMIPVSSERARVLAGKCRCGAVRYEVVDAFLYAANCHCSECRAATGSAFKAFAGIEREKLTITEGVDELAVFGEEDLNDTRCRACGSFLFSVVRDGAFVHVAMGSLIDAPTIRSTKHIFVGSKAAWFEITDDLPQFDEYAT